MNLALRYDNLAATYDARWRSYNRAVHNEVLRHIAPELRGARVLDVGCGTGEWLEVLLARRPEIAQAVGVEPSREMLNRACKRFSSFESRTQIELLQSSAEEMSFQDASFDLVTSLNVLHYLENPPRFFAHAQRVLDVGATLIVQDYTRNSWPLFAQSMRIFDAATQQIYTPRELTNLATDAGFQVRFARVFRISAFWRGVILVARKKDARSKLQD